MHDPLRPVSLVSTLLIGVNPADGASTCAPTVPPPLWRRTVLCTRSSIHDAAERIAGGVITPPAEQAVPAGTPFVPATQGEISRPTEPRGKPSPTNGGRSGTNLRGRSTSALRVSR